MFGIERTADLGCTIRIFRQYYWVLLFWAICSTSPCHLLHKVFSLTFKISFILLGDALGGHLDDMEADWSKPIVSMR